MNKNARVKVTLLLNDETLKTLKKYSFQKTGSTNMSKAVMLMAQEYDEKTKQSKTKINS